MISRGLVVAVVAVGVVAPGAAFATNGYFSEGYGIKNKGFGGAATARAVDTMGGANNPASMVWVGNKMDLGITLFSPHRESSRVGSIYGLNGDSKSDENYFGIPEFGFNHMISDDLALGVTVYGNGGLNTNYRNSTILSPACGSFPTPIPNPGPARNLLCGTGNLGVNLSQLIIAPTIAYKFHPNHSIGIAPLIGYQRFKAQGLQAFGGFSLDPASFTNSGADDSWGFGARVGYFGRLSDSVSIGAAYATKMSMDDFSKYKGLYAEQGGFDIPSNWSLGIVFKPVSKMSFGFDFQRINYGDVKSINNPSGSLLFDCFGGNFSACLGGQNGAGFGWQSINVFKVGVEYEYDENWTFRAGYNYGDNPIKAQDVTINILAPGVIQNHITAGASYKTKQGGEWSFFGMYAFSNEVSGPSLFNPFPPALSGGALPPDQGFETIKMYQWATGVSYQWSF
jgi:long-chain fatty acid transport protein